MGSLDFAQTRALLARGVARRIVDDSPVAVRFFYKGAGVVTSVTVDNTAEDFEFICTEGTYTFTVAAYATVGALADAVNATGIFEARVIDALRSDSTDDTMIDGAITVGADENGKACWDLKADTSVVKALTVSLSPKGMNYETPASKGHRVHVQSLAYNANVSAAEAGAVRIYLRRGATETLVWAATSVDATDTLISFAASLGKISGVEGDELIARVQDATSVTNAASNFIQIVGIVE